MKSKSKPGPAGEKSRRAFFRKIGTAAAASSLAASVSAAQEPAAPDRASEREFVAQPGPLSKQPMPKIRLGKHEVGRLVLGINHIGSHYSEVLAREGYAWNTPERQMKQFKHCEELGINLRVQTRDQIVKYNAEHGGKLLFSSSSGLPRLPDGSLGDPRKTLKEMAALGPIAIHYSASGADNMWRRGEFKKVREFCKMVRDAGVLVAVNGHIPEMFMQMESEGWDVDYYMTGLYLFGRPTAEWEKLYKANPGLAPLQVGEPATEGDSQYYGGQVAWVRGDPPEMLKVIKQVKKPCLVFKLLASGNLMATALPKQQQAIVESRFKYVFEHIKSTDAVVVAMWDKYEDQYAINKEYVVKYSGSSIRVS